MKNLINKEETCKVMLAFRLPRYSELPNIPLYKDQVITYIEETLRPLNTSSEEIILTPTMLNNYVKQRVVYPPKNRRYDERHLAYLIVVCLLKQVYSLTDICELINHQIETEPIEKAYDFFCTEFENAIKYVFGEGIVLEPISSKRIRIEAELVRASAICVTNKLFVQKFLSDKRNIEENIK